MGGISTYLIAYKHTAEVGINLRFSVILVQIKATPTAYVYIRAAYLIRINLARSPILFLPT